MAALAAAGKTRCRPPPQTPLINWFGPQAYLTIVDTTSPLRDTDGSFSVMSYVEPGYKGSWGRMGGICDARA